MPDYERHLKYVFGEIDLSMLCGESIEDIVKLANTRQLTTLISKKKLNDRWVFGFSKSIFDLISTLRKLGVNKVLKLLKDAQDNNFVWELKRDVNLLDLSDYS